MRYGFIHQMPSKFQTDFIVIPGRSVLEQRKQITDNFMNRTKGKYHAICTQRGVGR